MKGKELKENKSNKDENLKSVAKKIVTDIQAKQPGLFDDIKNPEKKEEIIESVLGYLHYQSIEYQEEHYSGPLPPPTTLAGYESIVPGSAERILKSSEIQSEHRQYLEKKVIESQVGQSKSGQILGFIIAILFLLAGGYLILKGHDIAGTVLSSLDIVGLVSVFVIGRSKRMKSLNEDE